MSYICMYCLICLCVGVSVGMDVCRGSYSLKYFLISQIFLSYICLFTNVMDFNFFFKFELGYTEKRLWSMCNLPG